MLKKVSIVLSVIAALGLTLALAAPETAFAKKPDKNNQAPKKVYVKKNVQVKKVYVVGNKYNGHIYYGRHRHRWHGTWYDYGVGPCWINFDGVWFWNVAACP